MFANKRIVTWPVAGVALVVSVAISLSMTAIVAAAQFGTVVLAEMSAVGVIAAFTLLVWAAIQDGKPREELAA